MKLSFPRIMHYAIIGCMALLAVLGVLTGNIVNIVSGTTLVVVLLVCGESYFNVDAMLAYSVKKQRIILNMLVFAGPILVICGIFSIAERSFSGVFMNFVWAASFIFTAYNMYEHLKSKDPSKTLKDFLF